MGRVVRVRLEPSEKCRKSPGALLMAVLLDMRGGDRLVVEGVEYYMRHSRLLELLEAEGLTVVSDTFDGATYRVEAVKPGGGARE